MGRWDRIKQGFLPEYYVRTELRKNNDGTVSTCNIYKCGGCQKEITALDYGTRWTDGIPYCRECRYEQEKEWNREYRQEKRKEAIRTSIKAIKHSVKKSIKPESAISLNGKKYIELETIISNLDKIIEEMEKQ